jgi:hypothetical protein
MAVRNFVLILLTAVFSSGCSVDTDYPPILVLADDSGYGAYTREILKAEGFNEFGIDSLNSNNLSSSYLDKFDILILTRLKVDPRIKDKLEKYVRKGGNLIAFDPDPVLQDLLGIRKEKGQIAGFIAIDTTSLQGRGLTNRPIQIHVNAERYSLNGGRALVKVVSLNNKNELFPAVVENTPGRGKTIAFLFNLPENIVLTRQGNPALAGIEKDGIPGIRAMDMFIGDWIFQSNSVINQADEQMQLLSHSIESVCTKPLPRFWYFPDKLQSFITLTNDGEYMGEKDFNKQFRDIDSLGAKMTLYVLKTERISPIWVKEWTKKGFEISGHPDNTRYASDPDLRSMTHALTEKQKELFDGFGLKMETVVNHWFVWCGKDQDGRQNFASQAGIEAEKGIRMDINYAHYDNNSNQGHFLGPLGTNQGNFTGSGLPMKFACSNGKILNIYQYLNNVYDQQYNENKNPSGFYECFKGLLDRSLDSGAYSFISIKSHNDEYYFSRDPLMKMLDYARGLGIPVTTAADLLAFLEAKDESIFNGIRWSDNMMTFNINSPLIYDRSLTVMLPSEFEGKKIKSVAINKKPARIIKRSVKGFDYILFTVIPGIKYNIEASFFNN